MASNNKHTAGPWAITDDWLQHENGPCVGGQYFSICVSATSEADRHLLMAAPELLEALQLVWDTYGMDPSVDSSIWQTVRAAIARATGEAA